jgi:hypothetical protein
MNERIKQLWDEAAKLESDPSWEGQTRFMEKFAELIVRECIWAFGQTRTEPSLEKYILDRLGIRNEQK